MDNIEGLIGELVSVTTQAQIRYTGVVKSIDEAQGVITLSGGTTNQPMNLRPFFSCCVAWWLSPNYLSHSFTLTHSHTLTHTLTHTLPPLSLLISENHGNGKQANSNISASKPNTIFPRHPFSGGHAD